MPDLIRVRLPLVNVYLLGEPGGPWVLVDAGLPGTASLIRRAAQAHFGDTGPEAVVLTHGHLDYIGGLRALLNLWDVPVYAHPMELPYLTGRSAYPPPDPTVGGSMSQVSPLFVPGPFDFRPLLRALPADGSLPHLPGWRWLFTPGHSPGHVSLWREDDRVLIAGDAFVTTRQESVLPAMTLRPRQVRRPPAYYTPDWDAARASVQTLAALRPELAATGHGQPMSGGALRTGLTELADHFETQGQPRHGRYVRRPALTDMNGVQELPPAPSPWPRRLLMAGVALGVWRLLRSRA
ncbi:MBL fold metallo-hydrolase [Deinococcus sp.]|uniref:MBL fold metallo-hydrolase n=1 Tax=Deinococcus sp. TaxID=47478 RepID=UPI003C7A3AA6